VGHPDRGSPQVKNPGDRRRGSRDHVGEGVGLVLPPARKCTTAE
jgi:hypothetical protein